MTDWVSKVIVPKKVASEPLPPLAFVWQAIVWVGYLGHPLTQTGRESGPDHPTSSDSRGLCLFWSGSRVFTGNEHTSGRKWHHLCQRGGGALRRSDFRLRRSEKKSDAR